ncbi:MAG: M23 family metallopeptidase [Dermatophilaceae bacterium]
MDNDDDPEADARMPGPIKRRAVLSTVGAGILATSVLADAENARAAVSWRHPFTRQAPISSGWGPRTPPCSTCSPFHTGLDYIPGAGVPVHTVAAGTVATVDYNDSIGYHVTVTHADGYSSLYWHLQGASPLRRGSTVPASALMGHVGDTGSQSTGPHLHVEIRHPSSTARNSSVDPYPLIHNAPLATPGAGTVTEEDEMRIFQDNTGRYFFVGPAGMKHIGNPQHLALLQRVVDRQNTTFNVAEIDMIASYMRA